MHADVRPHTLRTAELFIGLLPSAAVHTCQAAQVDQLGQFLCTLMKADMSPQALSTAELLTGPFPSAAQHVCQA